MSVHMLVNLRRGIEANLQWRSCELGAQPVCEGFLSGIFRLSSSARPQTPHMLSPRPGRLSSGALCLSWLPCEQRERLYDRAHRLQDPFPVESRGVKFVD